MQRSVISAVLIPLTRYSPTLECHHLSTNRGSWITVMPIWKNVVPVTFDMPFTMPLNTSVTGMNLSEHILQKNEPRESIYNVALSHATKKLVRTIYAMEKSGQAYTNAA